MLDLLYVAITLAFFALCVAYTFACDRIIGRDEATTGDSRAEIDAARPFLEAAEPTPTGR